MRLIVPFTSWWKTRSLALQIATVALTVVIVWWSAIEWSAHVLADAVAEAAASTLALRGAELATAELGDDLVRVQRPATADARARAVRHLELESDAIGPVLRAYPGPAAAHDRFARALANWTTRPTPRAMAALDSAHRRLTTAVHAAVDEALDSEFAAFTAAGAAERRLRIALLLLIVLLIVAAHASMTRCLRALVRGAAGLANGSYERAEMAAALDGFREGAELANALDRLSIAVSEREQVARSEILQLRQVEQMKTDFVSTVSHELRTPLTSIRGSLGLVLATANGELGAKATRLLNIASQNTDRLIRLINDILDVEKIEAGHVALKVGPTELRSVIRTTLTGLEGYATEAGVSLLLAPGIPVVAMVDSDRLVQVFTNLVSNAIKFSPAGSAVRLAIETGEDAVRITVRDQGPGIPPAFRDKIFGKFQQADLSDAKAKNGTGLGLAIARSIVLMHHGDIGFEPTPGGGTTFIVTLPWSAPPAAARRAPGGGAAAADPPVRRSRPTILVAECDAGVRELLVALCAPLGDIICAATIDEALAISEGTLLDAAIVDPEIDPRGTALLQRLTRRHDGTTVPVLVFSGREYGDAELDGLVLSRTHAFVKSRDSERELVMRLGAVLAARRAG